MSSCDHWNFACFNPQNADIPHLLPLCVSWWLSPRFRLCHMSISCASVIGTTVGKSRVRACMTDSDPTYVPTCTLMSVCVHEIFWPGTDLLFYVWAIWGGVVLKPLVLWRKPDKHIFSFSLRDSSQWSQTCTVCISQAWGKISYTVLHSFSQWLSDLVINIWFCLANVRNE